MTAPDYGALYVVATPIGNLEDLTARAIRILGEVACIAAEDTRHSAGLLRHLGLERPLISLHEHNEEARIARITRYLEAGESVALISDAGTPLISDPGFLLVRELRRTGHVVIPVPGACALIAALSAAGLPTDRFTFQGFLPAKQGPRRARLEALAKYEETLVFYESPHRIHAALTDIEAIYGERHLIVARELTKTFETFLDGTPSELLALMREDTNQTRGEFVLMVEGASVKEEDSAAIDAKALLQVLLEEGIGVKQSSQVAARLMGGARKDWYTKAQALKDAGKVG